MTTQKLADQESPSPEATQTAKESESSAYLEQHFLDISEAVTGFILYPALESNTDLQELLPGWPHSMPNQPFCQFSVPEDRPIHPQDKITTRKIYFGIGRGIPDIHFSLDQENDEPFSGMWDPVAGRFYTSLSAKGNGPTSIEMQRVTGEMPDAQLRIKKNTSLQNTWGLCWEEAIRDIEYQNLEEIGKLGIRTGRVLGSFTLDRDKTAAMVNPYYRDFPNYSIDREIAKANDDSTLAIAVRIGSGARACIYFADENPGIEPVQEALFSFFAELKYAGLAEYIQKTKMPEPLAQALAALEPHQLSTLEKQPEVAALYFSILSFLLWRNYLLQVEYNSSIGEKIDEALFMNFKPWDWDLAGNMFDADIVSIMRSLAEKKGIAYMYQVQRQGIEAGLAQIAKKLTETCSFNAEKISVSMKETALEISSKQGFLDPNTPKLKLEA